MSNSVVLLGLVGLSPNDPTEVILLSSREVTFHELFNSIGLAVDGDSGETTDEWLKTLAISLLDIAAVAAVVVVLTCSQVEHLSLSQPLSENIDVNQKIWVSSRVLDAMKHKISFVV